mgnify:CR=1 FL=1
MGQLIAEFGFPIVAMIRMLDNDMIRLQQKVNTILQVKENEKKRQDPKL